MTTETDFRFDGGATWLNLLATQGQSFGTRPVERIGTPEAGRRWLGLVGFGVVGELSSDDLDRLVRLREALRELAMAAVAGRDIYYDQRYAHNVEMRDVLEEIITHPENVDPQTLDEVQRYTKLFWINTGPYNNLTARKFVLKCTPEAFAAAAQA